MPTLVIDMPSGVAGDMLLAALADLGGDLDQVERDLDGLGVGPIRIARKRVSCSGIAALQVDVQADQAATWLQPSAHTGILAADLEAHPHRPYRLIRDLLAKARLPEAVRTRAQRVFRLLAEGEGRVHGVEADQVEFHEVGGLDAIADVVGCCLLLEQLGINRVVSGPLLPGEGWVTCAHGRMPVPVPAVAAMLATSGAPHRRLDRDTGELTTPTGAALVIGLTDAWLDGSSPTMRARSLGHGAGHKIIPGFTNLLRCLIVDDVGSDRVCEIRCSMDDVSGESLADAIREILAAGALDAYLCPILMKKSRPGYELTVLCRIADRDALTDLVFLRTPTIGVRHQEMERRILPRTLAEVHVDGHAIPLKIITLPDGNRRAKPEADRVSEVARILGRSFDEVAAIALERWRAAP